VAGALLLLSTTIVAYYPAVSGPFIGDDEILVTRNDLVQQPDGLWHIWFSPKAIDYWPLTNSSFWLEWRLWKLNPIGYHVANLALHLVSVLLLWAILTRLEISGAFLAAFLFAIHPVNVESVAWISQRKNTLSMVFFLASVWCWLKFERLGEGEDFVAGVFDSGAGSEEPASRRPATQVSLRPATGEASATTQRTVTSWKWYWFCLISFTFAMFAKSSVATLPVILWIIIWWQKGRLNRRDIVLMAPMFLIAAALSALNMWCQNYGTQMVIRDATFGQRLLAAGTAVWFYISKALLPIEQLFVYPKWEAVVSDWRWYVPFALCAGITIVLWARRGHASSRGILAAWLFFCAAILPALGFVDVGFMKQSLVADHYQHIAMIAVVVLAAAGWSICRDATAPTRRVIPLSVAATICAALCFATWRQNELFGDPIQLYETTLRANPDSWMAHNNLGGICYELGDIHGAITHFRETTRLNPELATAQNNLGLALMNDGKVQEAVEHFQRALSLDPSYPQAESNLGAALARLSRTKEAIEHYQAAIRLAPLWAEPRLSLGVLLAVQTQFDDAIGQFREALRLMPDNLDARLELRGALVKAGRFGEADAEDAEVRRMQAIQPPESLAKAEALAAAGAIGEAIEQYRAAIMKAPACAGAHSGLAMVLAKRGALDEAISEFQRAALLAPEAATSHLNLAYALNDAGRYLEAVDQLQSAIQINPSDIDARMRLALLYVKTDKRMEAVESAKGALNVAQENHDTASAVRIEQWLKSFHERGADATKKPSDQ
jgi:tetratricopeptide (TPR) repeat protein